MTNPWFGPGHRIVERAQQLPQVAVAPGNFVDADHQSLEVRPTCAGMLPLGTAKNVPLPS